MNRANAVAKLLLQIKAIKLSPQKPFTWASGLKSPIYCDNRTVLSFPEVRNPMVAYLQEAMAEFSPVEVVAGVATAGIPHAAFLADRAGLPLIYVRDKPKGHGRENRIEGELTRGARVLVIEDLISTGGSSLAAVEAIREAGAEVLGVLALFSYGFPVAEQNFSTANCPLRALSNYPALLEVAIAEKYITAEDWQLLQDWRRDPGAWSSQWAQNP